MIMQGRLSVSKSVALAPLIASYSAPSMSIFSKNAVAQQLLPRIKIDYRISIVNTQDLNYYVIISNHIPWLPRGFLFRYFGKKTATRISTDTRWSESSGQLGFWKLPWGLAKCLSFEYCVKTKTSDLF